MNIRGLIVYSIAVGVDRCPYLCTIQRYGSIHTCDPPICLLFVISAYLSTRCRPTGTAVTDAETSGISGGCVGRAVLANRLGWYMVFVYTQIDPIYPPFVVVRTSDIWVNVSRLSPSQSGGTGSSAGECR